MKRYAWAILICWSVLETAVTADSLQADDPVKRLSSDLAPWLDCLVGRTDGYAIEGHATPEIDGQRHRIDFRAVRYDANAFDLEITHAQFAVEIRRRADAIAMALPKHKVVFVGQGQADAQDHLAPDGALVRLVGNDSSLSLATNLLMNASADDLANTVLGLAQLSDKQISGKELSEKQPSDNENRHAWTDGKSTVTFEDQGRQVHGSIKGVLFELALSMVAGPMPSVTQWDGWQIEPLDRSEMERQLARGVRRACEVLAPGRRLTAPPAADKRVEHGRLRWIDGSRVVLLEGSPEEIGTAHGQLLADETLRCIDSVLYAFGTVQTVVNGRWFRQDLEAAYARLAPHIPERHKIETRALARSLRLDAQLVEAVNVFPELFHCSGFAVFGDATKDGKLYHGRVLDYMTTIGLQDCATTFVVSPKGWIPFANVGYAGFIGSVSGMNTEKISLGEMGGRGEGQWDGAPMATLMRRALEECDSLSEVKQLWQQSPRTCEYYYVFADGEERSAVGVAATPDKIEFINPGQSDPRLGEGITDAVVLSAGSRLDELRKRVIDAYGQIDAQAGQQLMCRPVAMSSNLHNVLFVPEDGVLYVANADHDHPAAERPYVRLDLHELVQSMAEPRRAEEEIGLELRLEGEDSLAPNEEPLEDSRACLDGLLWEKGRFDVAFQEAAENCGDWLVRFPSPRPSGDAVNDLVAMEWYQAKDEQGNVLHAPAAVIVHESGSRMTVGRLIAQGLRQRGLHAFMIQLPYYGERRSSGNKPTGPRVVEAMRQAIGDVRRARDAVAVIPHVDATRISLQGTSLGGFVTATTAGLDSGFHRVFIFLAGGDLFDVLMQGKQDAANLREELAERGIDAATIKTSLGAIEPLRLAHRIDPDRTWMFSAKFDDVVPIKNADLLARAAGIEEEHHCKLLANHYSGVIYLPMVLQQMRDVMFEPATVQRPETSK